MLGLVGARSVVRDGACSSAWLERTPDKREVDSSNLSRPTIRGCSSAGRAPALHAGGHRFDPVHLHHFKITIKKLLLYIRRRPVFKGTAKFQAGTTGINQFFDNLDKRIKDRFNIRAFWCLCQLFCG
jgi:hypothetical protein